MVTPTYQSEVIDRIIFSRWHNPPTKDDVAAMMAQMEEAARRLGQNLLYIASISPKAKVPDAQERAYLNQMVAEGRRFCEQSWLVYEGTDLQHNLQRVIISGVLILTRTFDNYLSVAKSADAIVKDVGTALKKDASPIFKVARERGLIA
ncbi:DofB protein [Corallococcus sp. H22C18031201]|nr:DofB protein [Myxococcaceae bacterium JPH2]MBU8898563.1 DofB protein [Citreicoccus inhibens]RJS25329.1 DofB protein [Corallococcus sp. H22C18031201]